MKSVKSRKLELFDAHCHLQDKRISSDIDIIIKGWRRVGGTFLGCCATCENDWQAVAALSEQYPCILPSFGIHPWSAETAEDNWAANLESLLDSTLSGIGEIGLDLIKKGDFDLQTTIFKTQISMAKEKKRPVSIHMRKAWDPFIHILKHIGPLPAGGLIHAYSGSADMIPLFEKFGFYISFSGLITNRNNKKIRNALQNTSLDRILIETDSPDMVFSLPGTLDPKTNKPENLVYTAAAAAETLNLSLEKLARITVSNGKKLFHQLMDKKN
ncbi:MAG: TatD family hydrolase [Desulfobacteraceae bacterium]